MLVITCLPTISLQLSAVKNLQWWCWCLPEKLDRTRISHAKIGKVTSVRRNGFEQKQLMWALMFVLLDRPLSLSYSTTSQPSGYLIRKQSPLWSLQSLSFCKYCFWYSNPGYCREYSTLCGKGLWFSWLWLSGLLCLLPWHPYWRPPNPVWASS